MLTPYGDYSENGREFVINTPDIPRNWYNYMFTDNYITFTSQTGTGQGFLQDSLGRRLMAVESRGLYIMEGNEGYSLFGLPVYSKPDRYRCVHGTGYSVISLSRNHTDTDCGMFVPCEDDPLNGYEVHWIRVRNTSDRARTYKILACCENSFDGEYHYQGYNTDRLIRDNCINGLHFPVERDWNGNRQHFESFLVCAQKITGYDCARNAFIGPYGSYADPAALHHGGCSGSSCVAEKMCFALQTEITVLPGEYGFCTFVMGIAGNIETIRSLTERFSSEQSIDRELQKVKSKYLSLSEGVEVITPDQPLNHLMNVWLKYQTILGSRWARVRHNGFRDICSDTECLSSFNPSLAWERLKRILSYQYPNGYAPRTFIDGAIRDNSFSDNTVWITFTSYAVISETGRKELLLEEIPFNDGSAATLFEHIRRSVDFLYRFRGLHNLVRIWGGDWNDCMNTAGLKGRGVSVWLSIAWYRAAKMFEEICRWMNKSEEEELIKQRASEMREIVNRDGWDEKAGYFIYGYDDDGDPIGHSSCKEGKVFLNPQIWSVFSGICDHEKSLSAMTHAENLLKCDLGTRISTPPYTKISERLGSIARKSPGVQENGGVYLHAMCWKLAADAMLSRPEQVEEDIQCILPFRNRVVASRAEPYTLCNCYMGAETGYRYGTPGQSWRTASGQWFLKAMLIYVFGLFPSLDGLHIRPCMPPSWKHAEVTKLFRNCRYHIIYRNTGVKTISVNGKQLHSDLLPLLSTPVEVEVTY